MMAKKNDKKDHPNTPGGDGLNHDGAEEIPVMHGDSLKTGAGAPSGGPDAPENETTQDASSRKERELENQIASLNERHIRLLAEYDNYRKRTAREMESIGDYASEKLIREFLPILDNLDRATEHRNDKTTLEEYVKGIALIEEQLRTVLAKSGLLKMDVLGVQFDPASHDAIFQVESPDKEPGIVVGEAEKGYLLNGKVIRHPKVIISK